MWQRGSRPPLPAGQQAGILNGLKDAVSFLRLRAGVGRRGKVLHQEHHLDNYSDGQGMERD